ncbi:hypothetical protein MSAN_01813600 [Mycena sanguinolenta]|uniref:DUF6534 domain-containing protein n=1 Tax=Mycena sanguinolenta TaxID=230812 RepID=A0A8H7CSM2_9AGAR|nr:hypothetical protein MSAN_01813600 [Mycena sanguinolenta]
MDSAPSLNLNPTLGAIEIGVLLSCVLFGVSTTQYYIYCNRFPDDSRGLKALTTFVWYDLRIGIDVVSRPHAVYDDYLGLRPTVITLRLPALLFRCTVFFAFRIYAFTKKPYIPGLVWFLAFLQLLGRVVIFGASLRTATVTLLLSRWRWLLTLNWSINVACDVTIAATMVIALCTQRGNAHTKTAALMDKLIIWTIETGMLTSLSSGFMLAFFVKATENYVWIPFYAVATALFPNSLMARHVNFEPRLNATNNHDRFSLNSRTTLRTMNEVQLSLPSMPASLGLGDRRQGEFPFSGGRAGATKEDTICRDGDPDSLSDGLA